MSATVNHSAPLTRSNAVHVLHVVLALDVGGLERNVVNQVREGQKLGQHVSVLCLDRPGALAEQVRAMGGRLVSLGRKPGIRLEMVSQVRRVLRSLRPDIVHTHQLATLLYGGIAAKLARVPVIVHTEHGKEPYDSKLRKRLLGRIAGWSCRRFYCLSNDMAAAVRAARVVPECKIRVIQNGIDVARFLEKCGDPDEVRNSLKIPASASVIGTVGRLTPVKRQEVLLRAFARVRQDHPEAFLVVVGDGPLADPLAKLAKDLGIADFVRFLGFQPHSGKFLQIMNVFALTSRSEGTPQAVLEAMVNQLPVVATRVGGIPELIQDGVSGILVDEGDDRGVAAAIGRVLEDRALAGRLGAAARARVETRYSIARMAGEYHKDAVELLDLAASSKRNSCPGGDVAGMRFENMEGAGA